MSIQATISNVAFERPAIAEPVVLILGRPEQLAARLDQPLRRFGCRLEHASDPKGIGTRISGRTFHVVWIVSAGDGSDALDWMQSVHGADPLVSVVIAAATPDLAIAVRAIHAGADDYVALPSDEKRLQGVLQTALERQRVRERLPPVTSANDRADRFPGIVGNSPEMRALRERIVLVSNTRSTVLLTGETGTGKTSVAEAIHGGSNRATKPLVRVHCMALAETLLESELFGHEKGAFTGAHARREGRFKMADGGTIFLDEIGEISPSIQVKLLRVLQQREFERVGGSETISVDVRIIAATNRDLRAMVAAGEFRADLYFRLNVVGVEVPPLRARRGDVPVLVEHHVRRLSRELGIRPPRITPEAMRLLTRHEWPGNVRELENVLERALVLAKGETIDTPQVLTHLLPPPPVHTPLRIPGASMAEIERHAILTTYESCGRSPQRTAEILGISLRTVHYRLREYEGGCGRRRPRIQGVPTADSDDKSWSPPRSLHS